MDNIKEEKAEKKKGGTGKGNGDEKALADKKPFKVIDKRFWTKKEKGEATEEGKEPELYPSYVEELKASKEESEKKLLEYIQAFKRIQAEHEEYRMRLKRDIDKKVAASKREIFMKLLEMLDNLDRAILSASNTNDQSRLLEGIVIARDQFLSILNREGVEKMKLLGATFDPNLAEAMIVEEVNDPSKNNLILEEIQPGYTFQGQTLRAAKVKVAKTLTNSKKASPKEE
ncbi:MAG: nucleotide exchange factor GrpE [Acidobacteriota bacterium]